MKQGGQFETSTHSRSFFGRTMTIIRRVHSPSSDIHKRAKFRRAVAHYTSRVKIVGEALLCAQQRRDGECRVWIPQGPYNSVIRVGGSVLEDVELLNGDNLCAASCDCSKQESRRKRCVAHNEHVGLACVPLSLDMVRQPPLGIKPSAAAWNVRFQPGKFLARSFFVQDNLSPFAIGLSDNRSDSWPAIFVLLRVTVTKAHQLTLEGLTMIGPPVNTLAERRKGPKPIPKCR